MFENDPTDGMETTRDRTPWLVSVSCAATARLTSLPDAIKMISGCPPVASAITYAPCANPEAAA